MGWRWVKLGNGPRAKGDLAIAHACGLGYKVGVLALTDSDFEAFLFKSVVKLNA